MTTKKYVLGPDGEAVECSDLKEWSEWFEANAPIVLKQSGTQDGKVVSTVFLGIDYGFEEGRPILWETMLFNGPGLDGAEDCQRSCSRAEALYTHRQFCGMYDVNENDVFDLSATPEEHKAENILALKRKVKL